MPIGAAQDCDGFSRLEGAQVCTDVCTPTVSFRTGVYSARALGNGERVQRRNSTAPVQNGDWCGRDDLLLLPAENGLARGRYLIEARDARGVWSRLHQLRRLFHFL